MWKTVQVRANTLYLWNKKYNLSILIWNTFFADYPIINVRRKLYKPATTAGKGVKWEWLSVIDTEWHMYNMDVQNLIEDAWTKVSFGLVWSQYQPSEIILKHIIQGAQMYDLLKSVLGLPFRINFNNLTEVRHPSGPIKNIRRVQQAPYPLIKVTAEESMFGTLDSSERSTKITVPIEWHAPPSHHGNSMQSVMPPPATLPTPSKSKKLFPNLVKTKHDSAQANTSSSAASTSTKLARQIFNNLNIFSHKPHYQQQMEVASNSSGTPSFSTDFDEISSLRSASSSCLRRNSPTVSSTHSLLQRRSRRSYRSEDIYFETDGGSSCCSTTVSSVGSRRPSIDTISTYLSHDSNEMQFSGPSSIASYGDDDVFLPPASKVAGSIVGVDADSDMISRFVTVVHPPKWPNCKPCSMCLEELQHNPTNPAVSLIRCEHLMHLNCLNHLIINRNGQATSRNQQNTSLYIECPVCGIVYGEKHGNQPPGTMSWSIIPKQLAGHEGQNTIQIIYK